MSPGKADFFAIMQTTLNKIECLEYRQPGGMYIQPLHVLVTGEKQTQST